MSTSEGSSPLSDQDLDGIVDHLPRQNTESPETEKAEGAAVTTTRTTSSEGTLVAVSRLQRGKHILDRCDDHWGLEVLSCVIAVCSLLAIVVILATHEGKPLATQATISINSWISIFTAIMKAAIMLPVQEGISQMKWLWFQEARPLIQMDLFDSASRGPWGALLLLLSSYRGHHLASLGAVITIIALAIDPFSQQVIQYNTCQITSSASLARLPRTNNYTADAFSSETGAALLTDFVAGAIQVSAMNAPSNETDLLPFICPSGNCTFAAATDGASFQSLGMCHSCKEINSLIRANETSGDYYLDHMAYVGYVFPNSTNKTPYSMFWSRKTLANSAEFDDLFTIDALALNVDSDCNLEKSENCTKHPLAWSCSIYPCIKTYNATIVTSVLNETILASTTPLRKTNSSAVEVTTSTNLTWSLATERVLLDGRWTQCNISDTPSGASIVPVGTNNTLTANNPNPGLPLRYFEPSCVWNLGYIISLALNQYLSWMYDNEYLESYNGNTMGVQGAQFLTELYRNGTATLSTVDQYFEDLTDTITAMMRQHGEGGQEAWMVGNVLETHTCIGVQWAWISLPALLVLAGVVFLVVAVVRSVQAGMWKGAWRSSGVVPFIVGLNNDRSIIISEKSWKSKMEEQSADIKVRLVPDEQRLEVLSHPAVLYEGQEVEKVGAVIP
ncbi:hypothetical protein BT63DRAFT_429586 [Microthyrium microscopicum]|uniref:Uncharacterized protein n=1 Tax=Microthyrium microscopicum TaxID=703497 RepID=A0A6A6TVF7_9PEZI|nr:hypothetical protein BT63DRAFT_429586 [Microthyrium microscopicum]